MARSLGAQKDTARHRMTKQDYDMIVSYLENPDNFAAIIGGARKMKIVGKIWTKVIAFGHMQSRFTLWVSQPNIEPPAVGDASLLDDMVFDIRELCEDSQLAFSVPAAYPLLSGDEEEATDREEEPIDLSEDDEVDNQTAPVADGDEFYQTAMPDVVGGDEFYQTVWADENAILKCGKNNRSRNRPPPPKRKTVLIIVYEEQVKEKLRKETQDQKVSFGDTILEDRRQAREQRERAKIHEGIEAMCRARADRRSTFMAEMVKTEKSIDQIQATFLLLDNVEERLRASMWEKGM
ncbi:hypothetical protein R1sor_011159 [Riccia sorocarpa]|uniref:Transposase n=1 Tax=Riccia sorocarpa TaxID=122646 RepID=A0ABD3I036_9MARC